MRWVRYLVGGVSFLLVFVVVTFLVTLLLSLIVRPETGQLALLSNWRGWIGLAAGFLAGAQSWNASIRRPR
jgi:hypothetical protein